MRYDIGHGVGSTHFLCNGQSDNTLKVHFSATVGGERVSRWRWPSGYALMPCSRNCAQDEFCELRLCGLLGSSHRTSGGGIMLLVERDIPL